MTFVLFLTGLLFIGAIAFFVAFPLFAPETAQELGQVADAQVTRWEKQKTDAYAAIKEAEFDLQMGKLTHEDYQALRERYEARALEALAQLDELTKASEKTDAQERENIASEA
jgi:gas vesicle protein